MLKLIKAYRANATIQTAQKIRAYDRKHPMSRSLLTPEENNTVADAIHHANRGTIEDAIRAKFPGLGDRLIVI